MEYSKTVEIPVLDLFDMDIVVRRKGTSQQIPRFGLSIEHFTGRKKWNISKSNLMQKELYSLILIYVLFQFAESLQLHFKGLLVIHF